ncbi:MAG: ATP-dependent zinc metalloprotease FtsH [Lachnospiraceae bacterium]|nr:ATP-dependent zinc metalloprotease FtsH [Lachnospiraceae bacterium]
MIRKKETLLSVVIFFIVLAIIYMVVNNKAGKNEYSYSMFENDLALDLVNDVVIKPNSETPTGTVEVELKNSLRHSFYVSDVTAIEQEMKEKFPQYSVDEVQQENKIFTLVINLALIGVMLYIFMAMMSGQASGGARMANFSKSHAKLSEGEVKVDFDSVAGLREEKEELEEIVDFLKSPKKYTDVGARIPKGVLLEGPPGTGKTLLAKAVAGEAGVPFFSISGSDFVEMFVGVGASRVRDLFDDAKKNAPCIVFIDEIDAVARRRGTGMGGGHDEREQTLNQLLVEMDGFGVNEGIIVLAATNRVDILVPAIMRAGRFDRKVTVGAPDVKGRREILEVHAKNKPLAEDVNLEHVAKTTAGMVGADLENLMNEAAIIAARADRRYILMDDIKRAFIKVGVGAEKRSKVITDKDKMITAYHEAGHAILFHVLEGVGPVYIISVIPTGPGALGYTMPLPEKDDVHVTRGMMLNHIMVSLGGRIAEQIKFNDYTAGASQDIKDATRIARNMVMKYGMSEKLGMVNYADDGDEVFIGRDLAHAKSISEETAAAIDTEVRAIINDCYENAKAIILEHRDVLESAAVYLIENEKMTRDTFEALFKEQEEA